MTAPRAPGERPRFPTPLHRAIALAAAVVGAIALVQRVGGATAHEMFDRDPGVRVAGLMLASLAWSTFVAAKLTATGVRRLLGRAVSLGLAVAGAARLAGPESVRGLDAMLPWPDAPGARAAVGAAALALAAGYAWWRSPMRRASRRRR